MTSQSIKITGPNQWSEWVSAGKKEHFTANVKDEFYDADGVFHNGGFIGEIVVQRKMLGEDDNAATTLRIITGQHIFTIPGDIESEWLYRAGTVEGAEWSGEALLLVRVSD